MKGSNFLLRFIAENYVFSQIDRERTGLHPMHALNTTASITETVPE